MKHRPRSSVPLSGPPEVLVLDDDTEFRERLVQLLGKYGCSVRTATGIESALAEIGHTPPDVVVIDLRLGAGSALHELAMRLRGDRDTAEVALVAISGVVDPEWPVVRPFDAYLRKPVDPDLLAELIIHLTDAAGARRRGA